MPKKTEDRWRMPKKQKDRQDGGFLRFLGHRPSRIGHYAVRLCPAPKPQLPSLLETYWTNISTV